MGKPTRENKRSPTHRELNEVEYGAPRCVTYFLLRKKKVRLLAWALTSFVDVCCCNSGIYSSVDAPYDDMEKSFCVNMYEALNPYTHSHRHLSYVIYLARFFIIC